MVEEFSEAVGDGNEGGCDLISDTGYGLEGFIGFWIVLNNKLLDLLLEVFELLLKMLDGLGEDLSGDGVWLGLELDCLELLAGL